MSPRDIDRDPVPDFMKIGFFENIFIWLHVIFTIIGFAGLMLCLGIMYLITGVKIDTDKYGLNIESAERDKGTK